MPDPSDKKETDVFYDTPPIARSTTLRATNSPRDRVVTRRNCGGVA
jgi:hypothetical protein